MRSVAGRGRATLASPPSQLRWTPNNDLLGANRTNRDSGYIGKGNSQLSATSGPSDHRAESKS
jgi:hypothetical protein